MIVARELDIRTIDTISIRSYKGVGTEAGQGQLEVLKRPDPELMGDGEGILVVDDLVDAGTHAGTDPRDVIPRHTRPPSMLKPKGKPMVASYVTEVSQDTWIFFPWDMALQYVQPFRGED